MNKAFSQKPTSLNGVSAFGILLRGKLNAITDVAGVQGGDILQKIEGTQFGREFHGSYPHSRNSFQQKVPAAIFVRKWFLGIGWKWLKVQELGKILKVQSSWPTRSALRQESKGIVATRLVQQGNEHIQNPFSMPLVERTNDGYLKWYFRGMIFSRRKWLRHPNPPKSGLLQKVMSVSSTGRSAFELERWKSANRFAQLYPKSLGRLYRREFGPNQFGGKPPRSRGRTWWGKN